MGYLISPILKRVPQGFVVNTLSITAKKTIKKTVQWLELKFLVIKVTLNNAMG